jgi:hypothetical protein
MIQYFQERSIMSEEQKKLSPGVPYPKPEKKVKKNKGFKGSKEGK